jgi:cytochrome b6-f complex iron-sulfur subunit
MNRRSFLGWVGVGWVASSLPIAIAACSSTSTQPKSSQPNPASTAAGSSPKDGFQAAGTLAELNEKGQILNQQFAAGPVLVVRSPTDNQALSAVDPTCTHRACLVTWGSEAKEFFCPCHNSKFGPDGEVLTGPATKPLKTYTAKLEGSSVLVSAS